MVKVLLADIDTDWTNNATEYLAKNEVSTQVIKSHEHCQQHLEQQKFSALILNLKKDDKTGFDILKTLKSTSPSTKIIISLNDQNIIENDSSVKRELEKLGISRFLIKPYSMMALEEEVKKFTLFEDWTSIQHAIKTGNHDLAVEMQDTNFSPIPISIFHNNHVFIIDVYIRLGKGKYLKILHAGESMEENRIDKFENVKNIQTLYFKKEEKDVYIEFANNIINGLKNTVTKELIEFEDITKEIQTSISEAKNGSINGDLRSRAFEFDNPLTSFLNGPELDGIHSKVIELVSPYCQESYAQIRKESKLESLYYSMINAAPDEQKHSFLTSFLSSACYQVIDPSAFTDIKSIAIASMLHDIGKTQFTKDIKKLTLKNMDEYERKQFYKHCEYGTSLLEEFSFMNDDIKLIIAQHHERVNGQGLPKGLRTPDIHPMAQVVGLAGEIAKTSIEYKMTSKEAFKFRLLEPDFTESFSAMALKAMSVIFIKDKKSTKKKEKQSDYKV